VEFWSVAPTRTRHRGGVEGSELHAAIARYPRADHIEPVGSATETGPRQAVRAGAVLLRRDVQTVAVVVVVLLINLAVLAGGAIYFLRRRDRKRG
jgi:hypothetical protein